MSTIMNSGATLPAAGGIGFAALSLIIYLLRELNRSSSGAWRIVREKNREIHRLRWEVLSERYMRYKAQGIDPGMDPGAYVPPSDEELRTW